jgi:hypothetical protein
LVSGEEAGNSLLQRNSESSPHGGKWVRGKKGRMEMAATTTQDVLYIVQCIHGMYVSASARARTAAHVLPLSPRPYSRIDQGSLRFIMR